MKRNGQALVEFIIILPIIVIILLGIVDFGFIFYEKNLLENNLENVTDIWKDKKSLDDINLYLKKVDDNIDFNVTNSEDTTTIELVKEYDVITPGLNKILSSPYKIKVNRVIYNG